MLVGLDAFRHHLLAQAVGEADGRPADDRTIGVIADLADEGAVELEVVDREHVEVTQGRIAGAEIVDGDTDSHVVQQIENAHGFGRLLHRRRFGDLEHQVFGLQFEGLHDAADQHGQIAIAHLDGGNVDRHAQVAQPGLAEGCQLATGGPQHPLADRLDQAGLFGDADETPRHQQALLGMLPTHQRLDTAHPAAHQVDDRLVVQAELVVGQRQAQAVFDLQPVDGGIVHFLVEELEVVPPGHLGVVHGGIGILHQRLAIDAIGGIDGDTDTRRCVQVEAADLVGTTNVENQLFGHEGNRRAVVDAGQHDHELVATEPGDDIAVAHGFLQAVRHFDQQLVADMMAQGVVDHLETVEVDKEQCSYYQEILTPSTTAIQQTQHWPSPLPPD